jgi:hypothetical protein
MLAPEWSAGFGGVASFNRHLSGALVLAGAEVVCAASFVTEADRITAAAMGVTLVGVPDLTHSFGPYVSDLEAALPANFKPEAIVGYGTITGPFAAEFNRISFPSAKRIHIVHRMPGETEWYRTSIDDPGALAEERILQEIELSRTAFRAIAVGSRTYQWLLRELSQYGVAEPLRLDPGFDVRAEHARSVPPGSPVKVLAFGRQEDAHRLGLDLAAAAMGRASKRLGPEPADVELVVRGGHSGSTANFRQTLQAWSKSPSLSVVARAYSTDEARLHAELRSSSLVLWPSRDSGTEMAAVEAIVHGVPTLVSSHSNVGQLLKELLSPESADQMVVPLTGDDDQDIERWSSAIEAVLLDRPSAFRLASDIGQSLAIAAPWSAAAGQLLAAIGVKPGDPDGAQGSVAPRRGWDVRVRGYGDRPATEDLLHRGAVIGALADLIVPQRKPTAATEDEFDATGPTVVSVDGAWGVGKTSLIDLVIRKLREVARPVIEPQPVKRLSVREADRALSNGRVAVWEPNMMAQADPASPHPPVIIARFEPWAHQTSEQVWAGLTETLLRSIGDSLLPETAAATERYWFHRNVRRIDRMRLRRAFRKSVLSPFLAPAVLALAVPIVAQLARSTDTYDLMTFEIAGSNIALLITGATFFAALGHTVYRYVKGIAANFLPGDLFVGPVPNQFGEAAKPADSALHDPYHRAKSGYLYLVQHDVFDVLADAERSGHQIVVFVDDLDRCMPRATAEVFEAVNLFVARAYPATRFVLCLDAKLVASHLDEAYGDLKHTSLHPGDPSIGWSFLRKFIQLPIPMPPMSPELVPELLTMLLDRGPAVAAVASAPAQAGVEHRLPPKTATTPSRSLVSDATHEDVTPGPTPPPEPRVDAIVETIEHNATVRERMVERLREQPQLSVRETKRLLTIWQYFIRVLIRIDPPEPPLEELACHLVVVAEIIARWPAAQRGLQRRVNGEHGLVLLAKAVDDDREWVIALRRLDLSGASHKDCTERLRELLMRYGAHDVAGLAALIT